MSLRTERLGDEIRDLLAQCFQGELLRDPRVQGVTITHVRMSPDLQNATVFFRLYDTSQKDSAALGLNQCKGLLRSVLAKNLTLRRVPELRFLYDESLERGSHIEGLLSKINEGS